MRVRARVRAGSAMAPHGAASRIFVLATCIIAQAVTLINDIDVACYGRVHNVDGQS